MQFHQWAIAIAMATLLSVPGTSILAMDIQVGNIRVQTAPNGELYVDTPRGRVYLPPEDDYYDDFETDDETTVDGIGHAEINGAGGFDRRTEHVEVLGDGLAVDTDAHDAVVPTLHAVQDDPLPLRGTGLQLDIELMDLAVLDFLENEPASRGFADLTDASGHDLQFGRVNVLVG